MSEQNTTHNSVAKDSGYIQIPKSRVGRFACWVADTASPILVKEVRQAFSGRVFYIAFHIYLLVIFFGVLYSVSTSEDFVTIGQSLSHLIFQIVAIPLTVIVPLIAFRSLSIEYESGTIQLVSITSLNAAGIIRGKLGSSFLQIFMFLATTIPFLVFCLMFQFVDIESMFWLLGLMAVCSASQCTLAILLASFSSNRILLAILNFLILVGCVFLCFVACVGIIPNFQFAIHQQFFSEMLSISVVYGLALSFFFYRCSVSLISFNSENRTTRVRLAILVLVLVFVWGIIFGILLAVDSSQGFFFAEGAIVAYIAASIGVSSFLGLAGGCTAAEPPQISNRVRRELFQTKWFGWFTVFLSPGPGKGFIFYSSLLFIFNLTMVVPVCLVICQISDWSWSKFLVAFWNGGGLVLVFGMVNIIYGMFYMSLSYMLISFFRKINGKVNLVFALFSVVILFILIQLIATGAATIIKTRRIEELDPVIFESFLWFYYAPSFFMNGEFLNSVGRGGLTVLTYFEVLRRGLIFVCFVAAPALILTFLIYFRSVNELFHGTKAEREAMRLDVMNRSE